jgi:hypothetical protein
VSKRFCVGTGERLSDFERNKSCHLKQPFRREADSYLVHKYKLLLWDPEVL